MLSKERASEERPYLPSAAFESELIKTTDTYLRLYRSLGMNTPIYVFLSLLGAKGFWMGVNQTAAFFDVDERYPIDKDVLAISEVVINSFDGDTATLLKPAFDRIWNSCGYPGSLNYDGSGNWAPKAS